MPRPVGNPNLEAAREKARKSPRIGKRGKGKETLKQEKVREAWEQEMREHWNKVSLTQRMAALKEENAQERMFVVNQMMGKAQERQKIEAEITLVNDTGFEI